MNYGTAVIAPPSRCPKIWRNGIVLVIVVLRWRRFEVFLELFHNTGPRDHGIAESHPYTTAVLLFAVITYCCRSIKYCIALLATRGLDEHLS
jgi:hypothetical protein